MEPYEIARLADALLARLPRNPEHPHYTDEGFRSKMRHAKKREGRLAPAERPASMLYLIRREWQVVFRMANLTCRQKEVLGLRLAGKTMEEIGAMSGCTKQAVMNVLNQARRRLEASLATYPYEGLADVYREETQRGCGGRSSGRMKV